MVSSSTSASDTLMSPATTSPLSRTRSRTSTSPVEREGVGRRSAILWWALAVAKPERRVSYNGPRGQCSFFGNLPSARAKAPAMPRVKLAGGEQAPYGGEAGRDHLLRADPVL